MTVSNFASGTSINNMESKVILPLTVCEDDVIGYIASRYSSSPVEIITRYMEQEGIISGNDIRSCRLEDNEMAILRDLGLRPSSVEFVTNQ